VNKFLNCFIGFYIGISSIYWFPGLSVESLRNFKYIVYSLIVLIGILLLPTLRNKNIPKGIFGIWGLLLLPVLYLPSILLSEQEVMSDVFLNCLSFYLFIWLLFILFNNSKLDLSLISTIIINIIIFFVTLHIAISLFYSDITIPPQKVSYITFQDIGFNLSRTGWSNGLALFIPFCFLFKNGLKRWIFIGLIVYSQFLSGGRTGLLASLFIIFLYYYMNKALGKIAFIFSIIGLLILNNLNFISEKLRFDRLETGYGDDSLNQFSSDRIVGYKYGLEQWLDFPIFGKGIKNVNIEAIAFVDEIHNFWIKTIAESGLVVFSFYVVFVYLIFKKIRNIGIKNNIYYLTFLLILAGLIETMFEPNALFGSFQNSAVWWLGVAVILFNSNKIQNQLI
jgi:hypothetical protein